MQKIIFDLLFPMEKKVEKMVEKKWYFEVKKFSRKHMVFIFEKVKLGVGVYFSGALWVWDVWDMAEKNTQSLCLKFRFSPIAP